MSTDAVVPEPARRFLCSEIESVRQLEALLLLRGSAVTWTPSALGVELRSNPRWTEQQLEQLRAKGLVAAAEATGDELAYRYAPASGELRRTVDLVADLFARRKQTVIALIFAEADRDTLQAFSDAFRLRREPE